MTVIDKTDALDAMIQTACGARPFVRGCALGEKPTHFVVGDLPSTRDLVLGRPFCGQLADVLTMVFTSLKCDPGDCYVTYLVKAQIELGHLTEKQIVDTWLPIVRLEYALSGCEDVVAVGKVAKMFAAYMNVVPDSMPAPKPETPTILQRLERAWRILAR